MTTTTDFNKARLGTSVLMACGACHQETGEIALKRRGNPNGPEYVGPAVVPFKDFRCEFCKFVGMWMSHEDIEPGTKKCGAAKIVEEDNDGVRTLLAFVPFTEDEDRSKQLEDGTPLTFQHGMVIKAENRGDQHALVKILEKGI